MISSISAKKIAYPQNQVSTKLNNTEVIS